MLYNIPSGDASRTLQIYLQQTHIEMLYLTEDVRGRRTNAVSGNLEASEALERMLGGTDLEFEFTPDFTFATVNSLQAREVGSAEPQRADAAKSTILMVSRDQTAPLRHLFGDLSIDEVVVTGSLIHGVLDMTSPLEFVTKRDMGKTAYATVQDALQALPVNMGSTLNEAFGGVGNYARGVAANLRGLGAGATLVLIDGRRQPYSGLQADFVDLSTIPWSAVEHIEVLPDGASALYGSDAIAGVVNVIMRRNVSGAETQARYGMAEGGADQELFSQLFGTSWDSGNAVIAYQYAERTELPTSAREYAANEDQRPLGGTDHRSISSNPGNILDPATFLPIYAIPSGQNGTSLSVADLMPGAANLENRNSGVTLLPERKTHSVYLSARQELSDRFELFADVRLNKTDVHQLSTTADTILFVPSTNPFVKNVNPHPGTPLVVSYSFRDDLGPFDAFSDVRSYTGTVGAKARVGETWSLNLAGTSGSERLRYIDKNQIDFGALYTALADPNPATAFNPLVDVSSTNPATIDKIRQTQRRVAQSRTSTANFVADGTLMTWAMGPIRLAAGGEWRNEQFDKSATAASTVRPNVDMGRTVRSGFAELSVPLIGNNRDARSVPRLELSLAARYEEYTDFGAAANPKIGLKWIPFDSLKFRTSWGTSFRAPKLTDVYDTVGNSSHLVPLPDPQSQARTSVVLVEEGSNPHLHQEVGRTWTAGLDFAPRSIPGLALSLTYYSIGYDDRIVVPGPAQLASVLLQQDRWAGIIERQPTTADIHAVCESPVYVGGSVGECESAPVAAIVDLRLRNLAATQVSGLDLKIDGRLATNIGTFDVGLNSGYVLSFRQTASNASPMLSVLDTVGNPLALRICGSADWYRHGADRPGLGVSMTIDHFGGYKDTQRLTPGAVGSLTTLDLRASYRTSSGTGPLDDLEFGLNASNIMNKAPPFVDQSIGFDWINAVPYGRVILANVQKRW
jgi:iron complex outermembrane recepter protein